MKRSFLAAVPVILLMATACRNTAESTFQDSAAENESIAVTESAAITDSDAVTESTPVTESDEKGLKSS